MQGRSAAHLQGAPGCLDRSPRSASLGAVLFGRPAGACVWLPRAAVCRPRDQCWLVRVAVLGVIDAGQGGGAGSPFSVEHLCRENMH